MNQTTFSFPQLVNRTTRKIELSSNTKSINECLGILLRTRPGELLGDPNYGCYLIDRVYRYNGVLIQSLVEEDILNAVEKYEPRITMTSSDIELVQEGRILKIYLQYTIKETNQVNEYNMELSLNDTTTTSTTSTSTTTTY